MEIFLQKKVIENSSLTLDGLMVYIALRKLMNSTEQHYYVSNNLIAFTLTGKVEYEKSFYLKIKSGISNLVDMNLIEITSSISSNEYILDLGKLYFDSHIKDDDSEEIKKEKYFIKVYLKEVHTIMTGERNRFKLLKYFVFLIGTFNNFIFSSEIGGEEVKSFIGNLTLKYMSQLSKISVDTIVEYNKCLEEKELLFVYRYDDFVKDEEGIKSLHNSYSRLKNKEYAIKYCKQYAEAKGSYKCNKSTNKRNADKKKSYLQKFNAIKNGNGKKYSNDEIRDIFNFIVKYNKELESKDDAISTAKMKDLDVFDDFDFLFETEENNCIDEVDLLTNDFFGNDDEFTFG